MDTNLDVLVEGKVEAAFESSAKRTYVKHYARLKSSGVLLLSRDKEFSAQSSVRWYRHLMPRASSHSR